MSGKAIAGACAVLALCVAALIIWAVRADNDWETWCRSQGGHVDSHTSTTTVVGANGKVGVGTTSTSYCLTADGRILDVR